MVRRLRRSTMARADFEQAMGEAFGWAVTPPVRFDDASAHECCEVVWTVTGRDVTPHRLAVLSAAEIEALAERFGTYFDCDPPTPEQVRAAIARTLARWPVGSLGE